MDPRPSSARGPRPAWPDASASAALVDKLERGPDPKKPSAAKQVRWVAVGAQGATSVQEIAKLRVTHQLGVQLRDLRLLDPQLAASYSFAILAREKALVVNLDFIKCLVTMDHVYMTNLEDENAGTFLEELKRRLATTGQGVAPTPSLASLAEAGTLGGAATQVVQDPLTGVLPFELRVLECALDTVCSYFERMASDLEAAAMPALDALTARTCTANLERVRRIKSRLVRLMTRVETLKVGTSWST
jgi:magnesium transporter